MPQAPPTRVGSGRHVAPYTLCELPGRRGFPIASDAPAFPLAAGALAPLKAAAEAKGVTDFTSLWSGQSASLAREMPAAQLTRELASAALKRVAVAGRPGLRDWSWRFALVGAGRDAAECRLTALEHKCGTVAHINHPKVPMLLLLTVKAGTSASFLHLFLTCVLKGSGFFRQACYRRIVTARTTPAPRQAAKEQNLAKSTSC